MSTSIPSRREYNVTTNTDTSLSPFFEEDIITTLRLEEALTPTEILSRLLSVKSEISTSSSFAERQNAARGTRQPYRHIGGGACGTIFEVLGKQIVYKVAKNSNKDQVQLWNDYKILKSVSEAFERHDPLRLGVHVPFNASYVDKEDVEWWDANIDLFPEKYRERSYILIMERILPLPQPVREALIDLYCPEKWKKMAKSARAETDCLIRPYLGQRRQPHERSGPRRSTFTLRNFQMRLDQLIELGSDIVPIAEMMAEALAIMHWKVGIDGDDVEFVLGSTPRSGTIPEEAAQAGYIPSSKDINSMPPNKSTHNWYIQNFKQRTVELWLLDFNRCQPITHDKRGIDNGVKAFLNNDPYYPRPMKEEKQPEKKLWECFVARYLSVSEECFAGKDGKEQQMSLPQEFIEALELAHAERLKRGQEAAERARLEDSY